MKTMNNKQISKGKGINIPRGGSGKMSHEQHTGTQKPGVSGVSKSASGGFGIKGGNGKMAPKQAVTAAPAGRSGKGGGMGASSGGPRKKGYGGDAAGNPY